MRSPARLLVLALVALVASLVAAGNAFAVIESGNLVLPPFTKAQSGAGNAVTGTFNWTPATFSPTTAQDKQDIVATSSDGGAPASASLGPTAATASLLLSNGRAYTVDLSACQSAALCTSLPPTQFVDVSAPTRIDATPPTGTVQINGGAAFTNNPVVTST